MPATGVSTSKWAHKSYGVSGESDTSDTHRRYWGKGGPELITHEYEAAKANDEDIARPALVQAIL